MAVPQQRFQVLAFAAFTVGCAHLRPAESDACAARIEEHVEKTPAGWWLRMRVFNTSRSPNSGPVTRLAVRFHPVAIPARVAAPAGWSASIALCADGSRACGVTWEADH